MQSHYNVVILSLNSYGMVNFSHNTPNRKPLMLLFVYRLPQVKIIGYMSDCIFVIYLGTLLIRLGTDIFGALFT